MPRKPASENVLCLCRLLNILANFSNKFLHTGKQCGPRSDCSYCLQKWLLKSQADDKADDNCVTGSLRVNSLHLPRRHLLSHHGSFTHRGNVCLDKTASSLLMIFMLTAAYSLPNILWKFSSWYLWESSWKLRLITWKEKSNVCVRAGENVDTSHYCRCKPLKYH